MQLTILYTVLVCHPNDVGKNYVGGVYVGGYGDLCESGIFRKLCPVCFLVVSKCSSVLLQSIVMPYMDSGDDG